MLVVRLQINERLYFQDEDGNVIGTLIYDGHSGKRGKVVIDFPKNIKIVREHAKATTVKDQDRRGDASPSGDQR